MCVCDTHTVNEIRRLWVGNVFLIFSGLSDSLSPWLLCPFLSYFSISEKMTWVWESENATFCNPLHFFLLQWAVLRDSEESFGTGVQDLLHGHYTEPGHSAWTCQTPTTTTAAAVLITWTPLPTQTMEVDGRPPKAQFCLRFLTIKGCFPTACSHVGFVGHMDR